MEPFISINKSEYDNIMTADEARKLTKESKEEAMKAVLREYLIDINRKIQATAKLGNYTIEYTDIKSADDVEPLRQALITIGYEAKLGTKHSPISLVISWKGC